MNLNGRKMVRLDLKLLISDPSLYRLSVKTIDSVIPLRLVRRKFDQSGAAIEY